MEIFRINTPSKPGEKSNLVIEVLPHARRQMLHNNNKIEWSVCYVESCQFTVALDAEDATFGTQNVGTKRPALYARE